MGTLLRPGRKSLVCMPKWDCNTLSILVQKSWRLPQKEARERAAFTGASYATRVKTRAIRAVFETETQKMEPDASHWCVLLKPSPGTRLQPNLSRPSQNRGDPFAAGHSKHH